MKTISFILSSFLFIGFFYACDNNDSILENNSETQVRTRSSTPDPNLQDDTDTPEGDGGNGYSTTSYLFERGNFTYNMQKGVVVFTLSYDKSKHLSPITSVTKILSQYNTKYDLLECSVSGVKYDTNNDIQSFNVIVKYDIYKNEQDPVKSTEYHYVYYNTQTYLLEYTRNN